MKRAFIKYVLAGTFMCIPWLVNAQKIGFLLGSFVSERWYLDQKLFTDRVTELGGECLVEIAYEPSEQVRLAKKLIDNGAKVLVVVPLDASKAAEIVALAKSVKIPVVSYDRLILNNDISIYLSYDNELVGRLQAQYMLERVPRGNYFLINGPNSDNNSVLFRKGQLDVLKPAVARGEIKIIEDFVMHNWSEISAFERIKQYFAQGGIKPDAIIAANDALANGVIQALPSELAGKIPISGQDADLNGVRNIIAGTQAMTVYKPIKPLAYMAAKLAMDLANGVAVQGQVRMKNNEVEVSAILLDPVVVDIHNYKETVVKDGHTSLSEVVKNLGKAFEQERNRIQVALLQKEKALEIQKKENQQDIFMVILLFLFLSILVFAHTIIQKQLDNKILNNHKELIERKNIELHGSNEKLKELNKQLTHQTEEITTQRDAIAEQKETLEEVNMIIARQKEEILNQNEKLEVEVQKRTVELTQYVKQLEQYAFITSHNLRAPVARILGLTQLLNMNRSDAEETRFIIDKLIWSTHELDLVFKELNKILDIRTFSMEIFTPVSLADELDTVKNNLKTDIHNSRAMLESNLSDFGSINSIQPYIYSIFFHVISNAIKYRHPARTPMIMIKAAREANQIMIEIRDNGLGIPVGDIETVFQLYKRLHAHIDGRGVGLFLVKTQIEALGGTVRLESELGEGTIVHILLPDRNTMPG